MARRKKKSELSLLTRYVYGDRSKIVVEASRAYQRRRHAARSQQNPGQKSGLSLLTRYVYGDRSKPVVEARRAYQRQRAAERVQQRREAAERWVWRGN